MTDVADVGVIGGGPAGAVAAARLALLGHRVVLFAETPSIRPPETLSPAAVELLETVGGRSAAEAGRLPALRRALVQWGGRTESVGDATSLLHRGQFDAALLANAARCGVRVVPVGTRPERVGPYDWRVTGGGREVRARFVIDAAGRRGVLPGRKQQLAPSTLAVSGRWISGERARGESRIVAGSDGWYWATLLPGGESWVTAFLSPVTLKKGVVAAYRHRVAGLNRLLDFEVGEPTGPTRVRLASPAVDGNPAGADWLKVGDAAFTLDPLSSQGVQSAIAHALAAACVAHTLLTSASPQWVPLTFYAARVRDSAACHLRLAGEWYRNQHAVTPTPFWEARLPAPSPLPFRDPGELPDDPHLLLVRAANARTDPVPVLRGDVVKLEQAVSHPRLDRPVAFVAGVAVAPLLDCLDTPAARGAVLNRWAESVAASVGEAILRWCWRAGLIVLVNSNSQHSA